LPAYLIKGAGYTPTQAGWLVVFPALTQIFLSPGVGYWSQRLLARGVSSRVARGLVGGACVVISGAAMICLPLVSHPVLQVVFVILSFATGSVIYTLGPALIGEISPISQRGAMLGISNAVYTLAGLLAPWIMGLIVDVGANPAEGFRTGFEIAGVLIACGGFAALVLIDPEFDRATFEQAPVERPRAVELRTR
jgi:fucose permease